MRNKANKEEIAVKKGGVLLVCKPFAFVLKSDNQGKRCDFCFKLKNENVTLPRCSRCQFVYYCGPNCQRQAWIDHSSECAGFKKVAPRIVPDAARLMGKIIMKLRRGGDQEKGQISPTKFRVFKDLMSHYSDVKKDALRMEHYESLVMVLSSFLGADKLPNSAELLGIYGRICVNSFSILDREMLSVGTGVYLAASILDHSCSPTAVATFEGTTLTLRALQDLPSPLDWTKVRISYIELLASAEERRRELLKSYYFLCDCTKCCDTIGEARTLKSMLCSCGQPVSVPDKISDGAGLSCNSCGHEMESSQVLRYKEEAEVSAQELGRMKEVAYLDVTRHCLRRQHKLFHPLDLMHAKMLDTAFETAITMGHWDEAETYGVALLPAFRHYYGSNHPLLGMLYLKLAKIQNLLCKSDEAQHNLHEAKLILVVTHGRDSSLYVQEIVPLMQQLVCYNHVNGTNSH